MDIKTLSADEVRGQDLSRLREIEVEIRSELANMRMDIYQAAGANAGKKHVLRKNLARVLTVRNEIHREQAKA